MILKYFRKRKEANKLNLRKFIELNLPHDYIGFCITYSPYDIVPLLTSQPYKIGYFFGGDILNVRFTDIANATWYKVDYGDEIYEEPIVQIAENNIPEGGIFLDTRDLGIYNFENEPSIVSMKDRIKIADSFSKFLSSLKLYQLSNEDSLYSDEIDLEVPSNIDDMKLPWED